MSWSHVHLLGVNVTNAQKLLASIVALAVLVALRYAVVWAVRLTTGEQPNERVVFWTRQATTLATSIVGLVLFLSIWFEDTSHLTTAAGLIGAGLAFALQKVVTAFAGYLVILRGKTFTVGDRITMGGVRGDVISLGFLQTRIMEMGEPPSAQSDSNPIWVRARQYTGRVVSVTNDKVFDEPIYNYTIEFPFMWEELKVPISYKTDRKLAEHILLDCAHEVTESIVQDAGPGREALEKKYFMQVGALEPRVFYTITDNWVEMNVRFIVRVHGVRHVKDELARLILDRFDEAGIGVASGTYDIVGFPPIKLERDSVERIAGAVERSQRGASGARQ